MSIDLQLRLIGLGLLLLAAIHVIFPRYFRWSEELPSLSRINREMMQVHTFFIALTVALMGLLTLTSGPLLRGTVLGRRVAGGLAVFWFLRLLIQLFGYSTELWKGKPFETTVHVVFVGLWGYLATIFTWCALSGEF